jgi:hypothetical protein
MYFHSILITILSPVRTLTLPGTVPGTYHSWHDGVSPRVFDLHESIHILSLLLATTGTTKTVAMYFSFTSMIESYRVTSFAMRISRVFPLRLHQVVQYQYVHSATLLMQYRFQTVNQQLHAPRRQALLRLLRLRSTNNLTYND